MYPEAPLNWGNACNETFLHKAQENWPTRNIIHQTRRKTNHRLRPESRCHEPSIPVILFSRTENYSSDLFNKNIICLLVLISLKCPICSLQDPMSWSLDLQLPVQSVPITNKVVSSNPSHGEVHSIQHKVCQWLAVAQWFSPFPPPIKLTATI